MKLIGFAIASIVDANTGNRFASQICGVSVEPGAISRGDGLLNQARRSLIGKFAALVESALEYGKHRRHIRELTALSDHQLRDIGLHRGAVEAFARSRLSVDELERIRHDNAPRAESGGLASNPVKSLNLDMTASNDPIANESHCA